MKVLIKPQQDKILAKLAIIFAICTEEISTHDDKDERLYRRIVDLIFEIADIIGDEFCSFRVLNLSDNYLDNKRIKSHEHSQN